MKISARAKTLAKNNEYKLNKLRNRPYQPKVRFWSNLIQELNEPDGKRHRPSENLDCNWGGGKSGLTQADLRILKRIFSFKSMGASEYEWGDLGRSYQYIKRNIANILFLTMKIEGFDIFVVCGRGLEKDVERNLKRLVVNNQFYRYRILKEPIHLDKKLTDKSTDFVGGWDIDNDYLFFIKEKPYNQFKKLVMLHPNVLSVKRLIMG